MSLQLFVWVGQGQVKDNRIHYRSFTLNDQTYHVGDCVYLFPEDEQYPPYIARILAAFVDQDVQSGADPHCIEVKWFERRVNLEPSTKGIEESEREVFELEDTDINPIGCISGKCQIVKAPNYEEAFNRYGSNAGWFFCRGYFHQSTNSFVAYTPTEMAAACDGLETGPLAGSVPGAEGQAAMTHAYHARVAGAQAGIAQISDQGPRGAMLHSAGGGLSAFGNGVPDLDEESDDPPQGLHRRQQQQQQANPPPAQQQPASKRQKAVTTGRTCVECGATSTPQWREGPMGPKTLCNACGVRYVRSQQKAAGQKRAGGGPKNGQGRPKELMPPRAQPATDRGQATKRGTSQKEYPSEPPTSDGGAAGSEPAA